MHFFAIPLQLWLVLNAALMQVWRDIMEQGWNFHSLCCWGAASTKASVQWLWIQEGRIIWKGLQELEGTRGLGGNLGRNLFEEKNTCTVCCQHIQVHYCPPWIESLQISCFSWGIVCVLASCSGQVRPVKGIPRSLSVGQVIWAPSSSCGLVFVAWSSDNGFQETPRKLGIKYCYNRPCALYAAPDPFREETEKPSTE